MVLRAVMLLVLLGALWITENLSTKLTWRGRLSIRVLVAVVRFMIEAVPELYKTGATAEPTCDRSAKTARPLSLHQPCCWELLH